MHLAYHSKFNDVVDEMYDSFTLVMRSEQTKPLSGQPLGTGPDNMSTVLVARLSHHGHLGYKSGCQLRTHLYCTWMMYKARYTLGALVLATKM